MVVNATAKRCATQDGLRLRCISAEAGGFLRILWRGSGAGSRKGPWRRNLGSKPTIRQERQMKWMTAMLCTALVMTAAKARSQDGPAPGAVALPQPVIVAAAKAGGIPAGLALSISDRSVDLDGACIVR